MVLRSVARFCPCVGRIRRAARSATDRSVRIARGDRLFLGLNAANRDPERFADPDRFDPARPDNRHLAFGYGPHFCIGAPLARLEAKLAFDRLLTRISHIALANDRIEWVDNLVLRGVKSLKLHLTHVREAHPRERTK